jgi:hypothetical protein
MLNQGDQKFWKKCPIFHEVAQKVSKLKKCQNIFNKAQFKSKISTSNLKMPTNNHVLNVPIWIKM